MSMVKTDKLVFEYEKRDEEGNVIGTQRAIDEVDIQIEKGRFIAILGHNGSGKSTFAKHINALLVPGGGTMWVGGRDTKDEDELWNIRQSAGMVFQNPDNQIIATVVEEDVGFGPENLGVPTKEIWQRVDDALEKVGMTEYRYRSPNKLSGGQKQRVAIAGVVAMRPECIVLDEPTAMLDPNGRKEVIRTVRDLQKQEKVTVILITHYMEEVTDADYIYVMDKGKVVMEGKPEQIFSKVDLLKHYRLDVPQATAVADELIRKGFPVSAGTLTREALCREVVSLARERGRIQDPLGKEVYRDEVKSRPDGDPVLRLKNLNYIYNPGTAYEKHAMKSVDLDIWQGEFIGIIGHTGSGKSTLVSLIPRFYDVTEGSVSVEGINVKEYPFSQLREKVGMVPQLAELFSGTIASNLRWGNAHATQQELENALRIAQAKDFVDRLPLGLESPVSQGGKNFSGGQKQRLTIARALAGKPEILILDDSASALDFATDAALRRALKAETQGMTVLMVSQRVSTVKAADRILVLDDGTMAGLGTHEELMESCEVYREICLSQLSREEAAR